MRFVWLLVSVAVAGCSSGANPDAIEQAVGKSKASSRNSDVAAGVNVLATSKLRNQAADLARATINCDYQTIADQTHPSMVAAVGGRKSFVRMATEMTAMFRREGYKILTIQWGEPSSLIVSTKQVYSIYPYDLTIAMPDGKLGSQPSYFVCVSADGGSTWKFIESGGLGWERKRLKSLLPDLPDELPLPAAQSPAFKS